MRTDVKIGVVLGLLVVAGIVIYFSVTNGDGPSTEPGGPDAAAPGKTPSLDDTGTGEPSPKPPVEPDSGPLVTLPPVPPTIPGPSAPPLPSIADTPGPGGTDPLEPGGVAVTPDPSGPTDPVSPGLPTVPAPAVPSIPTTPGPAAPAVPAPGVLPDPGVGDPPGPVVTVRPPDAAPGMPAIDPGRVEPVGPIVPVVPGPTVAPGGAVTEYVVKEGDGLWKIAEAVYGKGWLWSRIAKANPDVDTRTLRVGQKLKIPPPPAPTPAAAAAVAALPPGGGKYYVVVDGDKGFWQIAEKNYGKGHLWPRIAKANPNVDPHALKIGQKIVIPPLEAAPAGGVVAPGGAGGGEAVAVDPIALPPGTRAYTVKSGDTLEAIAAAMYGAGKHWPRIEKANPGIDANALRVGKTLVIPPLTAEAGPSEPAGRPAAAPAPGGEDMPRTAGRPRPYFD